MSAAGVFVRVTCAPCSSGARHSCEPATDAMQKMWGAGACNDEEGGVKRQAAPPHTHTQEATLTRDRAVGYQRAARFAAAAIVGQHDPPSLVE
jgi:hypothetical protein